MGKRRAQNSYESVSRKINAGYGRGEGLAFKPWLSGHEFASQGAYIRLLGRTIPRLYCFMSRLEADAFILYDSQDDVIDILEQYYLTLSETIEICDLLHIKHPYSGTYYNPVTTDLLIHKKSGWIARSIKSSEDLSKPRIIEKLEIERVYFERRNIDWKIITEKELNRTLVQNLTWLYYSGLPLETLIPNAALRQNVLDVFLALYKESCWALPQIIEAIEQEFSLAPGTAVTVFKHLICKKLIQIDITRPVDMIHPNIPGRKEPVNERYFAYR